ncbi:MAG: 3-deoxy-manno-octulosonate cytidylyltransferase [Bacteroidota bacterium]
MKALGIIPARYASQRFPGKPLVKIDGLSMIQRVVQQAQKAASLQRICVATDDERIFQHVQSFGGTVFMTKDNHLSGTDRCAEVAKHFPDVETVINIQGDEPFIVPSQIDQLVHALDTDTTVNIMTLAKKIDNSADLFSPNIVKVVYNKQNLVHYFSRQPIPHVRGMARENWLQRTAFYKHIGLYGFRRNTLLEITQLPPSPLEKVESLEQLRWLENGHSIGVRETTLETVGIDTPEDLEKIQNRLII